MDNQHELGLGATGLASAYGPVTNPWDQAHCAGGSSAGSAAGVAARLVAAAVGSDSGGSARIPASWYGVVGLKLTYGALPYDGYTGANSTFSAPGGLARDIPDARLPLEALLARPLPVTDTDTAKVGIGIVRRPFWDNVDPEVDAACTAALRETGLPIREVELPLAGLAFAAANCPVRPSSPNATTERACLHIQADTRSIRAHWGLPHLWLYQPGPAPARQPTITCGEAPARTSIPSRRQRSVACDGGGIPLHLIAARANGHGLGQAGRPSGQAWS